MNYIIFAFFILFITNIFSQTLTVNVSGIRNTEGTIRLAFYTNSESFDKEKPLFVKTELKKNVTKGTLSFTYNTIKPGTYGIAILDDENSNQKMDYGWVLPKEGFGFSDYYHTGMSRPKFESFDFILKSEAKTVEIKLRYL